MGEIVPFTNYIKLQNFVNKFTTQIISSIQEKEKPTMLNNGNHHSPEF